jgi:hypothetical protein
MTQADAMTDAFRGLVDASYQFQVALTDAARSFGMLAWAMKTPAQRRRAVKREVRDAIALRRLASSINYGSD